jgi:23S rRNA pseudouridine955/2504/2580 synthase
VAANNEKPPKNATVSLVTVRGDSATRRLDNFLLSELKGLPRARVYRMIRSGEVRVNKRRAKPGYRLQRGDLVRIPPVYGLQNGSRPRPALAKSKWIEACILFEDDELLVVDKPAGLAVHGGSGISFGAIELLRAARPRARRLELVHRLDRDTSGCLLIAKRSSSLRKLHQMFRENKVDKTYLALLAGRWKGKARVVDTPLYTEHRSGGERHVRVDPDGKAARTRIVPAARYDNATLVRVELLTGRTHQIRVHAASIGHPVLGDARYGTEESSFEQHLGLDRMFLHASGLSFPHPGGDVRIIVESPLDNSLQLVLDRLDAAVRRPGLSDSGA